MTVEHVLRVFVDAEGGHGNPLGVVMDTADWTDEQCQTRAAELGYSETVFVDDAASGRIRIFTPSVRFPFAGHPTVGTAWLLHRLGFPVRGLETDAGLVEVLVFSIAVFASLIFLIANSALDWGPAQVLRRANPAVSPNRTTASTIRRVGADGREPGAAGEVAA